MLRFKVAFLGCMLASLCQAGHRNPRDVTPTVTTQRDLMEDTVLGVIQNSTNFQSLVNALDIAGLLGDFAGAGPFTLFAPSNSALALIPNGYLNTLTEDPGYIIHLQNLLAFHVDIEAPLEAADLRNGRELLMANEEYLTVTRDGEIIALSNQDGASANVLIPDLAIVSNGVVHQLDEALLPKFVFNNVYNETGVFFQNLLATAGLDEFLKSGEFTVIVPSNEAFVGVPEDIFADVDQLTEILQYHMIEGVLPPQQLQTGQYATVNGDSIVVSVSDEGRVVTFDGIPVQTLTLANNGLVYTIDAVLLPGQDVPTFPPQTTAAPSAAEQPSVGSPPVESATDGNGTDLVDVIEADENLNAIALALQTAGLVDQVRNIASATIFTPVDAAFLQVNQELMTQLFEPEWLAHLQSLLALHCLAPDTLFATDLSDGSSVTTLSGEAITIQIGGEGSVFINGPDGTGGVVIEADIAASNGVIHKLDSVLLPSWVDADLLEIGAQIGEISTFMDLLRSNGLDQTVATGLFTMLAPSNDAFEQLLEGANQNLTDPANVDQLIRVLQYHLVPGLVPAGLLRNGTIETLEGSSILSSVAPGRITFNDGSALFIDIPANNGLINIIDRVLEIEDFTQPPEITTSPTLAAPSASETPSPVEDPTLPDEDAPTTAPSGASSLRLGVSVLFLVAMTLVL